MAPRAAQKLLCMGLFPGKAIPLGKLVGEGSPPAISGRDTQASSPHARKRHAGRRPTRYRVIEIPDVASLIRATCRVDARCISLDRRIGLASPTAGAWPELDWADWQATAGTLHLWTQIVGKVRLRLTPIINHWWGVVFYVNSRGLTTSAIPYGRRTFDVSFDFIDHVLRIDTSDGGHEQFALAPMSVAAFYAEFFARLERLGIDVHIWTMPVEIPDAIPFTEDETHAAYDAAKVQRFWQALLQSHRVFQAFRARFLGKASPVHFFWGSF